MFRLLLFLAGLCSLAPAQIQSRLTGVVSDSSGAVVGGAKISARNVGTGVVSETLSNSSGVYLFPFLSPAEYEVACEIAGFKRLVRAGVVLETGSTRTLDLQLDVGAVTEAVEVRAAAPLLESESSTIGQFIERATVFNMPLESRRTGSLVRLMGAVAFKQENAGEQIPVFSMAGGRSQNQMWQLDGAIVQNMALGIAQAQLNPPSESLQEFKAEANNYAAEFGRAGGGLILMTTRSGTNRYHGAAYEFLRNEKIDTRTFYASRKAPLRYNIFGASFGGPVIRDRTFFFANYEGARRRDGVTVSNTIVPHPAETRGDFSARRDVQILDPETGDPFPGNVIPPSRIDPVARAFAALYPAPNQPSDPSRAPGANFVVNVSDKLTQDFGTLRLDHALNDNNRIYGRYSVAYAPQYIAPIFPSAFADSRGGPRENKIHNLVGDWIHGFSPSVISDARYMYSRRMHINRSAGHGTNKNAELGLKGVDPNEFATINITGLTALGSGTHERVQSPILTHQFTDSLTVVRGTHTIKTGAEFRYSLNGDDFNQQTGGNFSFNDRFTRSGLATFLLGSTSSASLLNTDIIEARTDYWGLFVQDDWKATRTLTLNFGLRWDYDTPRFERSNRQSGFDPGVINPVSRTPGVVSFSGRDGRGKYAHNPDRNNFAPRFGFAWRGPAGLLFRGGYGISYLGAYAGAVPFVMTNGFGQNASFSSPDGGRTPAFLFRNGMPTSAREELTPSFGAVAVGQAPRISPDFMQRNHVNGYAQQYNLTLQKEIGGDMLFESSYLANLGRHLGGTNININMIPLVNGRGPAQQSQALRPFPQFNNVTLISPPWGSSSYHALNLKLEKRYSNGLNFLMNYTYSKFLDTVEGNGEIAGGEGSGYTHIDLRGLDKSYSGNDIRHRYIGSSVYELPFGKGKRFNIRNAGLNAIAGGWTLGAVAEIRSGPPWGAIEQTNNTNTFSNSVRPNLTCNPVIGDGGRSRADSLARWFDTSCFQAPSIGVFGNAARNLGFGPGLIAIDMSVNKRWTFTERYNLQFRSDFYNVPNHPNFDVPNAVRGRGDFGRITRTLGTGRQVQLSLRLEF